MFFKIEAANPAKPKKENTGGAVEDEEILDPNQYYKIRQQSVANYKKKDENPYPHKFDVSISLTEFIEKYSNVEAGSWHEDKISVAGLYDLLFSGPFATIITIILIYLCLYFEI